MSRWAPDARVKLEQAALDLYVERGFASTTVAEIADRAGLTERTFFRHFADKREVLFGNSGGLLELIVTPIDAAPRNVPALEALALGLEAAAEDFQHRAEAIRRREAVIAANAELRERELTKLAATASGLTEALRRRGLGAARAGLAGQVAMALFTHAFNQWVYVEPDKPLVSIVRHAVRDLRVLASGPLAAGTAPSRRGKPREPNNRV